jgi:hypothetical protein
VRLDEIDHQMQELGVFEDDENVILTRRHKTSARNESGGRKDHPGIGQHEPGGID